MGSAEKAIQKKCGIGGYPTVIGCIPAISNKTGRVSTSMKSGNLSADSFLEEIKDRISRLYNQEELSCHKRKEYEDALGYLENALEYI